MEKIQAFKAALKTFKGNKIMVEGREDGVYIRLAGHENNGELFSTEWAKVYSLVEKSNTHRFADIELAILSKSYTEPDNRPLIEPFSAEILALCDKFGKSGQSGGSAPYTATALSQAIKKLLLQEPILPMTGLDDEWMEISNYDKNNKKWFQNKRCSALFKDSSSNLSAYYLDAIIWKTQVGGTWSGSALLQDGPVFIKYLSRQRIKSFPFTPKTFYIDVIEKEVAKNDFEFHIKNRKQLEKVFKYYDKYE